MCCGVVGEDAITLGVDIVDGGEVLHVGEEDGALDHLGEGRPAGLQDGTHVLHHLLGLGAHVGAREVHRLPAPQPVRNAIINFGSEVGGPGGAGRCSR